MIKNVTVVGMIYKSVSYLRFMVDQIKRYCISTSDMNIDYLIIANDANDSVLQYLHEHNVNHLVYNDPKPNDYYLNRIYRAWNFGGKQASGDIVVFINSDMGFSSQWLEKLIRYLEWSNIPCSRLVESGKLLSGAHAISKDFGRTADTYNETGFLTYTNEISSIESQYGGLYMPCAFYKNDFVTSGGYPEGNMYEGGAGAVNTPLVMPGDQWFFTQNKVMSKKIHITVFSSIVYHIQEGELDE